MKAPQDFNSWRRRYSKYAQECRLFALYLKRTSQGSPMMTAEHARQIREIAGSFREQAGRFREGVDANGGER